MKGLSFLVVGTPRSGTTLVQRIACEVPGVGMPPETHFLGFFALELLRRRRFPLEGPDLEAELRRFAAMPKSEPLNVNVEAVMSDLGGQAPNMLIMFDAIVRQLAGDADVYGEKSPEHLLWWHPMTAARPALKIVVVVRDPRAVVASSLAAWGSGKDRGAQRHVIRAQRWNADQAQVVKASRVLGPERCLILRYEDVVQDPSGAREAIASFLGIPPSVQRRDPGGPISHIVLDREKWKERIFQPITTERIDVWKEQLRPTQVAQVTGVCARMMKRFNYSEHNDGGRRLPFSLALLDAPTQWGRIRFSLARRRHVWWIGRLSASRGGFHPATIVPATATAVADGGD